MCNFLSAIVLKDGTVLCDPQNHDSHERLIQMNSVKDGHVQNGRFVRVEFLPPNDAKELFDVSKWSFKFDDYERPDWFNQDSCVQKLCTILTRMLVNDTREL